MQILERKAREYVSKHDLHSLLNELTAALVYNRPSDARVFLINQLKLRSRHGCKIGLSDNRELSILFRLADVMQTGFITREAAVSVLSSFLLPKMNQDEEKLVEMRERSVNLSLLMMSDKLISFNRTSLEVLGGGESGGKALSFSPWTLWEKPVSTHSNDHDHYSSATRCLSRITNVEDFWKYWLCVPQPSELLEGKHFVRETDAATGALTQIDTLMLFREGVRPEWEDPANASGGHLQYMFKVSGMNPAQLDEYWNNLAMGLVGGMIEPREMVTGIRLLDKSSVGRNNGVRIEVWFRDFHQADKISQLKNSIETCMSTRLDGSVGGLLPKSELKSHSS